MGNYTAVFGKLELKDDVAKEVIGKDEDGRVDVDWRKLKKVRRLRKHPDVLAYLSTPRCSMIVGGGSSSHSLTETPEGYEDDYYCAAENILDGLSGDADCIYDQRTRELRFFCSLKDYAYTIHMFEKILHLIADEYSLWEKFEFDPVNLITTTRPTVRVKWVINKFIAERERVGLYE